MDTGREGLQFFNLHVGYILISFIMPLIQPTRMDVSVCDNGMGLLLIPRVAWVKMDPLRYMKGSNIPSGVKMIPNLCGTELLPCN